MGPRGVKEKDVVLSIALRAAARLRREGVRVLLTRSDDRTVALEERTALANREGADLFVSIHANSHRKPSVRGVETYYLDVTDDRYALRLAAIENRTNEEQVSDVQLILTDLATKNNTAASERLARDLQRRLMAANRRVGVKTRDLGAKASLFYVLLGARMPAVLVETAFISNPTEARLLGRARYRNAVASAIADAVVAQLRRPLVAMGR